MNYYVKNKQGFYMAVSSPTKDISKADSFTEQQLLRRFNANRNNIIQKAKLSGFELIHASENNKGLNIVVKGQKYTKYDILYCNGTYYFEKGEKKEMVIYNEFRGDIRVPKNNLGKLIKIELEIIKLVGKIVV